MTKLEILTALKEARVVYSEALNNNDIDTNYCHQNYIDLGMCYYFDMKLPYLFKKFVINELIKDLFFEKSRLYFWYEIFETYCFLVNKETVKICLQPRLDHLNRTIVRLENELQLKN